MAKTALMFTKSFQRVSQHRLFPGRQGRSAVALEPGQTERGRALRSVANSRRTEADKMYKIKNNVSHARTHINILCIGYLIYNTGYTGGIHLLYLCILCT